MLDPPVHPDPVHHARRGFTLLEVTVVVVVLAIMAAMLVPRFAGSDQRRFRLVSEQVGDLLTMFAQREQLEQRPIGIALDGNTNELLLLILQREPDATGGPAEWRRDPFVSPVRLPEDVSIVEVRADEDLVDLTDWPLSTTPGEQRPAISITLQGPQRLSSTWLLSSHAIVPQEWGVIRSTPVAMTEDLDATGRTREDW